MEHTEPVGQHHGQGGKSPIMADETQQELEPLLPADPATAELEPLPVVPADQVLPEVVQPRRMRRTIATLDLKVAITIDGDTRLSMETIEKIENDLQAVKVQSRKFTDVSTKVLNDLLNQGEPAWKLMRCGVNGAVWTDSVF
jgi:hypothetical protein